MLHVRHKSCCRCLCGQHNHLIGNFPDKSRSVVVIVPTGLRYCMYCRSQDAALFQASSNGKDVVHGTLYSLCTRFVKWSEQPKCLRMAHVAGFGILSKTSPGPRR